MAILKVTRGEIHRGIKNGFLNKATEKVTFYSKGRRNRKLAAIRQTLSSTLINLGEQSRNRAYMVHRPMLVYRTQQYLCKHHLSTITNYKFK